jgi:hypothetical protein
MFGKGSLFKKTTGEKKGPGTRRVRFGIVAAVVAVAVLGELHLATDASNACILCHPEHGRLWRESTHRTVECVECHVDPGMSGMARAKIRGVRNVFVAMVHGSEVEPGSDPLPISTENCFGCHRGVLRVNELGFEDLPDNNLKNDGLVMGHRIHVEKHWIDCVWCHRGIVHRDPEIVGKYEFNMPFHQDCDVCHTGEYFEKYDVTLPNTSDNSGCIMCHPTYEAPPEVPEY